MKLWLITVLATSLSCSAAHAQPPSSGGLAVRICTDLAHGQAPPGDYVSIAMKLRVAITTVRAPITADSLERCRVLLVLVPAKEFTADERDAIVGFVRAGGSLLLAFDEECRTPLEATRVNDIIGAFGMKLTADTEYLHNTGAIARKGTINAADRELPYSGGRAVDGGTPFGWQLDRDGDAGQAFAAYATVGDRGRIIVLGDGMATLLLGTPAGVRLTGVPRDPARTTYWGKDSAIFVEELLAWLVK